MNSNKVNIEIKKLNKNNIKNIVRLESKMFHPDECFPYHTIRLFIIRGNAWGVYYNRELIGYYFLLPYKKRMRIYSIGLLKEYRNKGIGTFVMENILKYSYEQGYHEISLEVRTDNTTAINFYKKFDFIVVERLKDYYEKGIDGYRMYHIPTSRNKTA